VLGIGASLFRVTGYRLWVTTAENLAGEAAGFNEKPGKP